MNDYWTGKFTSDSELPPKDLSLYLSRRQIIVIVEPYFSQRTSALTTRDSRTHQDFDFVEPASEIARLVWMYSDRKSNLRPQLRHSGRANCLSSVPFKQVVNGLIERGRRAFTLDLSDCQLMDSTFLGVLVGLNRTLGQAGSTGGFSLYQPTEPVRVLLDNLGILELFGTTDSLGQAGTAESVEQVVVLDKTDLTRTSLDAHQTLIDANPGNEARFKEVTRFLEEDLKQQEAADSSD